MLHKIRSSADGDVVVVEVTPDGRETGHKLIVPCSADGSTRDYIDEIMTITELAPPAIQGVVETLEDAGFGRLTPGAIAAQFLTYPDELAATVDALGHHYNQMRTVLDAIKGAPERADPGPTPPWVPPNTHKPYYT